MLTHSLLCPVPAANFKPEPLVRNVSPSPAFLLSSRLLLEQDGKGFSASRPGRGQRPQVRASPRGDLSEALAGRLAAGHPPRPTAEGASGGHGEAGQGPGPAAARPGLPRAPGPALHLFRARSRGSGPPTPAEPPSLRPDFPVCSPPTLTRACALPACLAGSVSGGAASVSDSPCLSVSVSLVCSNAGTLIAPYEVLTGFVSGRSFSLLPSLA